MKWGTGEEEDRRLAQGWSNAFDLGVKNERKEKKE